MSPSFPAAPVPRALRIAVIATLAFILVGNALVALFEQTLFTMDGAFQTYAAVDEFARGHALGYDFQSYLGALMPLSIVPFYLLGGKSFVAAQIGARILVAASMMLWVWALGRLAGVRREAGWRLMLAMLWLFATLVPTLWEPGNSLRPLRWALAPLVGVLALPLYRRALAAPKAVVPPLVLGLVGGMAILWSNDIGLPAAGALGLALVALVGRGHGWLAAIRVGALYGAAMVATLLALFAVLTHGHVASAARYTFVDVPAWQFWYFGMWHRASRLFELADLRWLMRPPSLPTIGLLLTLVATLVLAKRVWTRAGDRPVYAAAFVVYLTALGGSLIPQLAGHITAAYSYPMAVTAIFMPLVCWRDEWRGAVARLFANSSFEPVRILKAVGIIFIPAMVYMQAYSIWRVLPMRTHKVYDPQLKAWIFRRDRVENEAMRDLARRFDAAGVPATARLNPTYYSSLVIAAGAHPPTAYPSIIHALGDKARADYVAAIRERRTAIVTTVRPDFTVWEGWNLRAAWPVYRVLFEHYRPVLRTRQNIIWARAPQAAVPAATLSCQTRRRASGSIDVLVKELPGRTTPGTLLSEVVVDVEVGSPMPRRWFWRVKANGKSDWGETRKPHDWATLDSSGYGMEGLPRLTLVAATRPDAPYTMLLQPRPPRGGAKIGQARCTATPAAMRPDFTLLPDLKTGDQLAAAIGPLR